MSPPNILFVFVLTVLNSLFYLLHLQYNVTWTEDFIDNFLYTCTRLEGNGPIPF